MNAATIERWLQDERVVEEYEISPGYIIAIRNEAEDLSIWSLSKSQIRPITTVNTLAEARNAIADYANWYAGWLAKRRAKEPTPAQLAMLFRWKVPIPLDLTFGQAWDIIDARMMQERAARAEKLRAKSRTPG